MSARRPYLRSMDGWWRRDPFFMHYMAREITAVFVAAYAVVLLVGLVRLAQGEVVYREWLDAVQGPYSLAFHVLLFAVFAYHTWSWFRIMPKTMPMIFVGGKRVGPGAITGTGLAVAAISCIALIAFVARLAS